MTHSLIARRFSQHIDLTKSEIAALEALEGTCVSIARNHIIRREDEPVEHAYVLKSGWAMSYLLLEDGTRQILRLHLPGDMVAMPSLAFRREVENLSALSDCTVAPFGKTALTRLFADFPRLAAAMFLFAQVERAAYAARLASVARTSAKARICFLLIDILERLRSADHAVQERFEMHLTQEQIADLTGQTAIHVNRMWRELLDQGLIAKQGEMFTLLDERGLRNCAQHVSRVGTLDFSWLPQPREMHLA